MLALLLITSLLSYTSNLASDAIMGAPVDGAYTALERVAFGDLLVLPGIERTITLAD